MLNLLLSLVLTAHAHPSSKVRDESRCMPIAQKIHGYQLIQADVAMDGEKAVLTYMRRVNAHQFKVMLLMRTECRGAYKMRLEEFDPTEKDEGPVQPPQENL